MISVIITQEERARLVVAGEKRNALKDPSWSRRKSDVFSDDEVDVLGMIGEYAVAKYFGLSPDYSATVCGDDGSDLLWNGLRIAVKYNHRWMGYLMVEERANDDVRRGHLCDLSADIVVLATGKCNPPTVCTCRRAGGIVVALAGWCTKNEFLERMHKRDLGLGGRYIVTQDKLNPMHALWQPWLYMMSAKKAA